MYRALYDYNSTSNGYLTFVKGDEFTLIGEKQGDWLLAQNGFGDIGYIPANYIQRDEAAPVSEVIKSIDRAMQAIHYAATSKGSFTHKQRENLKQLAYHREQVLQNSRVDSSSSRSLTDSIRHSIKRAAPPPPTRSSQLSSTILPPKSSASVHKSQRSQQKFNDWLISETGPQKTSSDSSSSNKSQSKQRSGSQNNSYESVVSSTPEKNDQDSNGSFVEVTASVGNQHTCVRNAFDEDSHQSRNTDLYGKKSEPNLQNNQRHLNDQKYDSGNNSFVVISRDDLKEGGVNQNQRQEETHHSTASPSKYMTNSTSSSQLSNSPSKFLNSPSMISFESISVPEGMASDMVEQLREHTGLSYPKSCLAVEVVLGQVAARMPQMASLMDKILMTFSEDETKNDESSFDGKYLQDLLTKLTACKDDAQQRSWSLFEDQQTITGYLEEILSILENAKSSVCRKIIAKDRYEMLHNLVEYYQMETRVSLRMLLLKCFGAMCSLEASIVSNLLYSILPLELVSEIQNKYTNVPLVSYVAIVLSMILSTGEPLPTNLSDHINSRFIQFMFDLIENPPSPEFENDASDQLMIVILALNLHYTDHASNPIMSVLGKKGTSKTFTEKLMMLFNRGNDPVQMFEFQTCQQNSVMKFMTDLYRDKSTSSLLYTNDARVLVDIIIRQLTDLQPGDKVRTWTLTLMNEFVENSDYLEYKYRESEVCRCLHNILHEESTVTTDDKNIVSDILDKIQDFT